jgi:hypothetical protein
MKALQSQANAEDERHKDLTCNQHEFDALERKLLESERLLREAIHYANDLGG